MNKEKVLDLAKLARISISDEEAENLSHEFDVILNYVGEVKDLKLPAKSFQLKASVNVMREDGEPHETGMYTKKILNEAPAREGNYFKVKKIL